MSNSATRRAIGIVRKSERSHEEDTRAQQRERIEAYCREHGLRLLRVEDERDVSGGTPLDKRHGLRRAIEAVENGKADVVLAAYFDRLVRDVGVQQEVVRRVQKAGGEITALDFGNLTNGTAAVTLSANMLGSVSQFHRDITREKSMPKQQEAIARGAYPAHNPLGYDRGEDKRLVPSADAEIIAEAFRLRATGASVLDIRAYMADHGIVRTPKAIETMLANRVFLGEIHFGSYKANLKAHDPIVDEDVWQRAQRVVITRGRRSESERLLARMRLLRCSTCGGGLTMSTGYRNQYPVYKCGAPDCERRMVISAEIAERVVLDATRQALDGVAGIRRARESAKVARADLGRANADLDDFIDTFTGSAMARPKAKARLAELEQAVADAQARVDQLGADEDADHELLALGMIEDFESLSIEDKRRAIRATIERVDVMPGRGADRLDIHLHGEDFNIDAVERAWQREGWPEIS
jgi:DNA invertase Pin-like site-specific DNA recombinase